MNRTNQKRMKEAIQYLSYSGEVLDYIRRTEPRISPLHKKLQEGINSLSGTIDLFQAIENSVKNNVPLEETEEESDMTSKEN